MATAYKSADVIRVRGVFRDAGSEITPQEHYGPQWPAEKSRPSAAPVKGSQGGSAPMPQFCPGHSCSICLRAPNRAVT